MKQTINQLASMLASELIGRVDIDQTAETVMDIARSTGRSRSYVLIRVGDEVAAGKLEKVWKKVGNNTVPAYRVKSNAKQKTKQS